MTRTFVLKKSTNKLKKWSVREVLPPKSTENNTNADKEEEKEEEKQEKQEVEVVETKKKYNPYKRFHGAGKKVGGINYGKVINFGQAGYRDYPTLYAAKQAGTIDDDIDKLKQIYINRHQKFEHWDDPNTAGFWSGWISWNKPTIEECIADIQERFDIIVKYEP